MTKAAALLAANTFKQLGKCDRFQFLLYRTEPKTDTDQQTRFLLARDYFTFGSFLWKIVRLSSVTFVRPTDGVETFGNISSPFIP